MDVSTISTNHWKVHEMPFRVGTACYDLLGNVKMSFDSPDCFALQYTEEPDRTVCHTSKIILRLSESINKDLAML